MAFYIKVGNLRFGWGKDMYTGNVPLSPSMLNLSGRPEWTIITNENAYKMYLSTAELFSVIRRRGFMLASGVWKHYKVDGKGEAVEVKNSDLIKLLDNPNPLMSGNDFLRQWSENELVHGNNFMSQVKGTFLSEYPSALHNLPPHRVDVRTTGRIFKQATLDGIIEEYRLRLDGGSPSYEAYSLDEIIHTKIVNGQNPIQGDSPLIPLYMEIGNLRAAKQFRNVIMEKHGALGVLSSGTSGMGSVPLTETERKRIEEQYQSSYGLSDNQRQILIAQSNVTWQSMVAPTKDLMLFEEVSADFRTIIDMFGLNDNMFSREKASTFTNLRDGLKHAYQQTTVPEAEEKAMTLSKAFGLIERGEFLQLEYDHLPLMQTDEKEKAEALNLKANAIYKLSMSEGVYTAAQIREMVPLQF